METKLLSNSENDLNIAAEIIRSGGTVVFPTETVYGLGADALNPDAVKKIFTAKGRPADNPLIVHIYDVKQLNEIVSEVPESAKKLMDKFWPGPLTIILKKSNKIRNEVTAGLDTVGVRMPVQSEAKRLLELSGVPIAAPSANLSGKPSPTAFAHCVDDMNGRVDAIIDGGDCNVGIESTVIDLSGEPIIYRPGDVTTEQIEQILNCKVKTVSEVKENEKHIDYFENVEAAIKVFKSGARMAKGTTTEKGLVESYFANPFGPVQKQKETDILIDKYFDTLYSAGVKVGQIKTCLGVRGQEKNGPKDAALELFDIIKSIK